MMDAIERALRETRLQDEVSAFVPEFESEDTIDAVQDAYRERILTLALGAGLSKTVNLPLWSQLVEILYGEVYLRLRPDLASQLIPIARQHGYNDTVLVRHLETVLGFRSEIRSLLRSKLYASLAEDKVSELIAPLCDCFLDSHAMVPVKHAIVYNFDNVLERHLCRMGRTDVIPVYSNETYSLKNKGLCIYHPHGFLPHPTDDPSDSFLTRSVVFSEFDYHTHYLDAGHWANVLQLHHFMSHVCLFVGTSMTDPNVRRLLDHARHRTNVKRRHVSIQRTKGNALADYFVERDLHSLGVRVLWVREYADIPRVLASCART